ncbi:hypothetical protein [Legionella jordanis]|uniref:Uncharacterized protein n=1 Tax=Legionella jordanis TaxID=456 RepID=A0A0W0VDV8_9GAMM|nr:hypothetical protein [Legionella jordanis]KTD18290.1 hypothetical protein Ljor_2596 [Legionella jordanis]RMX05208.1 hypothetical protein EAW55_00650 [Legionella jordanis]RMX20941.1 hypothetical protein EAS68_06390 [Legionella jordanis]VEH13365.1 Uncharacterised protein [Legionella jordanis]
MQGKNEILNTQLTTFTIENNQKLAELKRSFLFYMKQEPKGKGLLGQTLTFVQLTHSVEVQQLEKDVEGARSWKSMRAAYSKLVEKTVEYGKAFEATVLQFSVDDPESYKRFELAVTHYFRALDACQNAQEALGKKLEQQVKKNDFEEKHRDLAKEVTVLTTRIQSFQKQLEEFTLHLIEIQMEQPKEGRRIPLQAALQNLKKGYERAYDNSYGLSGFWRWLKNLFQKSDRMQEINFLATLSALPDCCDPVRYQAMALVHNKIIESESFGGGSKLKQILANLSGIQLSYNKSDPTLAIFLDKHQELYGQMPVSLQEYYNSHRGEYNQKGSVSFLNYAV